MAPGKAKSVDEITVRQLCDMMKIFDVSDDGLSVSQMRSRLRDALNQAEKTTNWSVGKVRY